MSFSNLYVAAAHRVQTGIQALMSLASVRPGAADMLQAKHIRVGLDLSRAEHSALAMLLVEKGVFTLEEYECAILVAIGQEGDRYENAVSDAMGQPVSIA